MARHDAHDAHEGSWLRGLAPALERLAGEGVARGAVQGIAEEVRSGVPSKVDSQGRALLQDGLTVVARLASEAAHARTSPLQTWSRAAASGATRGFVDEFRRLVPEARPTSQELFGRLKLWLERSAAESSARTRHLRDPGKARIIGAEAVGGAADQLSVALPALAAPAAELASGFGRGLVRGVAEELGRQVRAAGRSTLVRAVGVGGAVVALLLVARRR